MRQPSAAAAVRVGGWWFQSSLEGLELGFPSKFSETRVAGCFRSCPALCECASGCFSAACARALAAGGARAVHLGVPWARTWPWLRLSGARATPPPQALLHKRGETPAYCGFGLMMCSGKFRNSRKISLLSSSVFKMRGC